jgi:murein L,D-transpeptidase YcbB/YkuD
MRILCHTTLLVLIATAGCARVSPSETAGAIGQLLAGQPPAGTSAKVWSDVRHFYEIRSDAPAWTSDRSPAAGAPKAVDVIRSAVDHGLDPAQYGEPDLARRLGSLGNKSTKPATARDLAELDARLTTALLALGRDIAYGRQSPSDLDPQWKSNRPMQDLGTSLNDAVAKTDVASWLVSVQPRHPEYAALVKATHDLRGAASAGGWPSVPPGPYKPGTRSPAVLALRTRLAATGELPTDQVSSDLYDPDLRKAVAAFQEHHGLKASGLADADTVSAMNVPVDARLQQIAANLERWRWEPDDFGARYFIVNIPSLHVAAVEDGNTVKSIRVIVGKPDKPTPVLSAMMTMVTFSPYWNIPDTIVAGETAPAVAKDPHYLARNHIEILRRTPKGVTIVDPSRVHWDNPDDLKGLAFRQLPGPDNALGHVVFRFPNPYDVYLHDTPADSLFAQQGRALSHGCIRVEEPEDLAKYVLRDDPAWPEDKILAAMQSDDETTVTLRTPIPVHLVYFTAWVDEKGGRHFHPDIYAYDAQMSPH